MRLIDFHVHLFPERLFQAIWKWFSDYGWEVKYQVQADEVVRLLGQAGVEKFVLLNYSHKAGMSESLNAWTYEFCKKYPQIIPFGAMHPDEENVGKLLDRCFKDYGFSGLKFHTHVTGIRPDAEKMFPIYDKLEEHGRLLLLHSGNGPSLKGYKETTCNVSGAKFTRNFLKRYPNLKVIVPHLGADEFDEFFGLMEEFPNLWMDTTMAVAGFFPIDIQWDKIEKFSDRILYGTDFPNIPYDIMQERDVILASPLSAATKEKVFYKNALKLLEGVKR